MGVCKRVLQKRSEAPLMRNPPQENPATPQPRPAPAAATAPFLPTGWRESLLATGRSAIAATPKIAPERRQCPRCAEWGQPKAKEEELDATLGAHPHEEPLQRHHLLHPEPCQTTASWPDEQPQPPQQHRSSQAHRVGFGSRRRCVLAGSNVQEGWALGRGGRQRQ